MSNQGEAGLISGHAQFAKGAAEETVGNVTGSEEWKQSGAQDKQAGIDEMKAASANREEGQGGGKVEELAGKAVGCEGMEKEGQKTQ